MEMKFRPLKKRKKNAIGINGDEIFFRKNARWVNPAVLLKNLNHKRIEEIVEELTAEPAKD